MAVWKILFKDIAGGVLTQAADALIWPDEAGYGSDVVRALDETVGDAGFLRKLHLNFSRSPAGSTEDLAVATFHFAKIASDEATNAWVAADYAAIEARFATAWTALKPSWYNNVALTQYRWYRTGPAFPISGPPVRITTVNTPGTDSSYGSLPPQVSPNVSEHTRLRKHWGRFYLPAPSWNVNAASGRLNTTFRTLMSTTWTALYNGCRTDGYIPVVYSKAKPARKTKAGLTLPPQPARAYAVEVLDVDDVWDVIRSRRYGAPTARSTTTLT